MLSFDRVETIQLFHLLHRTLKFHFSSFLSQEFHVGFGGDEHLMQSVWTKTHNELGRYQSQRRVTQQPSHYAVQYDYDQAYQSGELTTYC